MREIYYEKLSFAEMYVEIKKIGNDLNVQFYGGDKPHIGCTVLAIPRPSLADDIKVSSTSSLINVTGHKDDKVCRTLAEEVCKKKNAVVACTGGFHVDDITDEQIHELEQAIKIYVTKYDRVLSILFF